MSIFPKRTVPSSVVTIHFNVLSREAGQLSFPYVKSIVRSPSGKEHLLFEGHVLSLPAEPGNKPDETPAATDNRHLNKNIPLLVLAGMLSPEKREEGIRLLKNIRQGKHYYFHYSLPENAELGKHNLETTIWADGESLRSGTLAEDFFFVEKLSLAGFEKTSDRKKAILYNPSPEPVPAKLVRLDDPGAPACTILELAPLKHTAIEFTDKAFLLYNEERECLSLDPARKNIFIRNQQYHHLSQNEQGKEVTYVLHPEEEEAFTLESASRAIWNQAGGLDLDEEEAGKGNRQAFQEMLEAGLLQKINLEKLIGPSCGG